MQLFINNWSTSLTVAATAEAASLSVPPVEAAKLIGLGSGDYYLLTLFEVDSLTGEELRREIVRATAVSGGNITVVRDQEDTGAQVWDTGQLIEARLTKETMETLRDSGGPELSDAAPEGPGAADPGLSPEASRSDHVHPLPTPAEIGAATAAQGAAADAAIPLAQKGAASGVAPLDAGAKIALIHLPATAITSTFVVNTEAAMLALSAQEGDVAIRPDISTSFILQAEPASTLANWQELLSPAAGGGAPVGSDTPQPLGTASPGVSTSASRQDHVHEMPDATDVGADPAGAAAAAQAHAVQRGNHTGTQTISTVTGLQTALDAKATNPMTAAGDLIVGGASGAPARLALGAPLQMPRVNAAGTGIEYADPPSGGGSLPVVQALSSTRNLGLADINTFNVNSTTNNYTATIPPQSSVTWTADAEIHFLPSNTGDITITGGAGVSVNGVVAGSITLSTASGAASMKRIAVDSWWLGGVAGTTEEQRIAIGLGSTDSPVFQSVTATSQMNVVSVGVNPLSSWSNTSLTMPGYGSVGFGPALTAGEVGRVGAATSTGGGLAFNAFTSTSGTGPTITPLSFSAYLSSVSPTIPGIIFRSYKHDGGTNRQNLASSETVLQISNGTSPLIQCLGDGTWRPVGDNTQPLGGASNRWSVVYAGTGTINTSDAREKTAVRALSSAEIAASAQLAKEIGGFKFLAAIQQKGDESREHIGLTVQRAIEVMESHGLDPFNYGFICHDTWAEQAATYDEEGNETAPHKEAGDRYGFRTDELLMFLAAGFEARLSALELMQ